MISYQGKLGYKCQMCEGYTPHTYLDNKDLMKEMFPEMDWKEMFICEKCAQREAGPKSRTWKAIKRSKNDNKI